MPRPPTAPTPLPESHHVPHQIARTGPLGLLAADQEHPARRQDHHHRRPERLRQDHLARRAAHPVRPRLLDGPHLQALRAPLRPADRVDPRGGRQQDGRAPAVEPAVPQLRLFQRRRGHAVLPDPEERRRLEAPVPDAAGEHPDRGRDRRERLARRRELPQAPGQCRPVAGDGESAGARAGRDRQAVRIRAAPVARPGVPGVRRQGGARRLRRSQAPPARHRNRTEALRNRAGSVAHQPGRPAPARGQLPPVGRPAQGAPQPARGSAAEPRIPRGAREGRRASAGSCAMRASRWRRPIRS